MWTTAATALPGSTGPVPTIKGILLQGFQPVPPQLKSVQPMARPTGYYPCPTGNAWRTINVNFYSLPMMPDSFAAGSSFGQD